MFDSAAAIDELYRASKEQLAQFSKGTDMGDVYGIGFFSDAFNGSVYLVANTEEYHEKSLRKYEAMFGQTDVEAFRWDIGNWKYPGGLFPSASAEQRKFDAACAESWGRVSEFESENKQAMLEDVCVVALKRLDRERAFSTARCLKGFTVLGPDDGRESVLEKKKRLDSMFQFAE